MKGGDRARVKTFRLSNQGWMQTRFEAMGKKRDGVRLIRYREGTFFPRTYKRQITLVDDQTILFTDLKGERVLRKGSSLTEVPLTLDGPVSVYYKNGNLASTSTYSKHILLSNQNWNSDGSPYINDVFYSADRPPVHPYGNSFIQNYITNIIAEKKFPVHEVHDEIIMDLFHAFTGRDQRGAISWSSFGEYMDVIDEGGRAYKDIDAVMAAQEDLVEVVHTLKQIVCVKG